jgi:hypothetical protein
MFRSTMATRQAKESNHTPSASQQTKQFRQGQAVGRAASTVRTTRPSSHFSEISALPPAGHGRSLEPEVRQGFEARFGQDLSGVRVHTDSGTETWAKQLRARAFTFGEDVFFGAGRYAPHSRAGESLLAHELTHVLQQRRGRSAVDGTAAEQEADHIATTMPLGGRYRPIREHASAFLQCKAEGDVETTAPSSHPSDPIGKRPTDVYGSGALTKEQWSQHLKTAKASRDAAERRREFELLFKDVALSAGASALLDASKVNWLGDGEPHKSKAIKPGLNLTPLALGAAADTGYVNSKGEFFGLPSPLETADPDLEVATIMSVQDFDDGKAYAVGVLRHELVHVQHARDALAALTSFRADSAKGVKSAKADPARARFQAWIDRRKAAGHFSPVDAALIAEYAGSTKDVGHPNSELLGHFEGFMTQFLLAKTKDEMKLAFAELMGALKKDSGVLPWALSTKDVREEALGRLRKFYLDELDKPHHDALNQWVDEQAAVVDAKDDKTMHAGFIRSLKEMIKRVDKPSQPAAH